MPFLSKIKEDEERKNLVKNLILNYGVDDIGFSPDALNMQNKANTFKSMNSMKKKKKKKKRITRIMTEEYDLVGPALSPLTGMNIRK